MPHLSSLFIFVCVLGVAASGLLLAVSTNPRWFRVAVRLFAFALGVSSSLGLVLTWVYQ